VRCNWRACPLDETGTHSRILDFKLVDGVQILIRKFGAENQKISASASLYQLTRHSAVVSSK